LTKEVSFVSPIGIAVYPKITKPDTKGEYADNKYKTELELSSADLEKVRAEIKSKMKGMKFKVSQPKMPIKTGKDGIERLIAKSKFLPTIIDARKVKLFDANAARTDPDEFKKIGDLWIGGGSRIKIGCTLYNYEKGVSLQLNIVQIIELVGSSLDDFSDESGTEEGETLNDLYQPEEGDDGEDALDI